MRHALGLLAMLLSLAACGDGPANNASEPVDPVTPVLVHATAGGGDSATAVTRLPDEDALAAYAAQFDGPLAAEIRRAAGEVEVGAGEVLVAQVVAVGCDVPPGATLDDGAFVAKEVPSPLPECLAPVTTVALAAVPA